MNEQLLPVLWVALAALFLLCLPVAPVQKLVLVVSGWALRLALLAILAAGAYLSVQPGAMPAEVSRVLTDFPGLLSLLPAPGSAAFGPALACLVVAPLVPVLAAIDFARRRPRIASVPEAERPAAVKAKPVEIVAPAPQPEPEAMPVAQEVEEPVPVGVPLLRPVERRDAAGAIASARPRPSR